MNKLKSTGARHRAAWRSRGGACTRAATAVDEALVARGGIWRAPATAWPATRRQRRQAWSGLPTPSTRWAASTRNIRDPATGIGGYVPGGVQPCVLREGVAKTAHSLYPAMPYPSLRQGRVRAAALYAHYSCMVCRRCGRPAELRHLALATTNMRWPLKLTGAPRLPRKAVYKEKPGQAPREPRAYLMGAGSAITTPYAWRRL